MIYNGFDPGVLALLAGEDRAVQIGEEAADPGQTDLPLRDGILISVMATVLLAAAILLGGIVG
ncbi:hypothetical protein [Pseudogemmobacter bohemicus]|uniref:hypothetical protein n=1 Tax=Pseudogemmobacter bohemicus TaxID=2250708 RepID=UPI000DD49130|nr:hypothetical protein [Pseudogemmobacter bohemicus]